MNLYFEALYFLNVRPIFISPFQNLSDRYKKKYVGLISDRLNAELDTLILKELYYIHMWNLSFRKIEVSRRRNMRENSREKMISDQVRAWHLKNILCLTFLCSIVKSVVKILGQTT